MANLFSSGHPRRHHLVNRLRALKLRLVAYLKDEA